MSDYLTIAACSVGGGVFALILSLLWEYAITPAKMEKELCERAEKAIGQERKELAEELAKHEKTRMEIDKLNRSLENQRHLEGIYEATRTIAAAHQPPTIIKVRLPDNEKITLVCSMDSLGNNKSVVINPGETKEVTRCPEIDDEIKKGHLILVD